MNKSILSVYKNHWAEKIPNWFKKYLQEVFVDLLTKAENSKSKYLLNFSNYKGTFSETTKVIFVLLDFDKEGIIKKEDVIIILSYLPINDFSEEKNKKR